MATDSLDLYDYDLPPDRIAQEPAARRDDSRLMVLDRATGATRALRFADLKGLLRDGDVLVTNDARVFPARLRARRSGGGDAEVLLLEPLGFADGPQPAGTSWEAIVRPARWARKLLARKESIALTDAPNAPDAPRVEVRAELGGGRFEVRVLSGDAPVAGDALVALCESIGEVPLPPYIRRHADDARRGADRQRYQTVYARAPVAVAAPTAGLHFTPELLAELQARGVEELRVTHQVGLGTFLPLREEALAAAELHSEVSEIDAETGRRLLEAKAQGRRIVAVGTTTVRALESFALAGTPLPYRLPTSLFIRPGHEFRLVDAMVTNFHLPRSSLLVLVSAFAGRERILETYRRAVGEGFRFYSYGDAMFIG